MAEDPLRLLSRPARSWFERELGAPTRVQAQGWERIATGEHALLAAPTGSGKTLAAFCYFLDRLGAEPAARAGVAGVRLLYLSPLKALAHDIERNLRAPLAGIARAAAEQGAAYRVPRVALRTGDTAPRERRAQLREPAEILVTTPESFYLLLGSRAREMLRGVEAVIVDEVHAVAASKRGAHLALSLERLAALCARDPQRIGLSATARPLDEVARFVGGDRPVAIVDAGEAPNLALEIRVPVPDMTRPGDVSAPAPGGNSASAEAASLWPALYPRLLDEIRAHRSTIVFANSRALCERIAKRINELAGERLVRAHHGSVAHEERREIEEALKCGELRGIIATSSLELGVDMPSVELVMSVESPGAVSRGLQRVGRAGHQVGGTSRGVIWPKHRGDLLEAVVVADGMRAGRIEPLAIPRLPLDVLAQQIVACAALDAWEVPALFALLRRAAPYRALSRDVLDSVLDLLAGRYPSTEFAELRARIVWDRTRDRIEGRPGSRPLALISGGTIPDRGLYAVFRGEGGPRLGELDEEMVHETRVGERITLGASTWRVDAITRDRVLVSPAPGEVGKLPFWRGDGPGRPFELGRALGAFARELAERCEQADREANARELLFDWLAREHGLDRHAAQNLVAWIAEQRAGTGVVASDRALCVERFRDELGDWRVCIHSPFGARVHAPWALAIEQGLGAERAATAASLWSDDGLVFRFADADEVPRLAALFPDPERLQERVTQALATSSLLAASFREAAARALLLPRRGLGRRTPLWVQRLRSQQLLAVAQRYPEFPILLEAYRECLQDRCDLSALQSILRDIREGRIEVREVETARPSPAARALAFEYTAAYLYQGDLPVAERRAQALSLDREALRELLGQEELRSLLDPAAIDAVERELQGLDSERRVASAGALHDLLRRVGELTPRELRERSSGDPDAWLEELERSGRALALEIAGERRYAAAEDAALYRDALEVALPEGLPAALLAPRPDAITELALRFARTHGPFEASRLGARFGLSEGEARAVLEAAVKRERLVAGELLPGGRAREYADPESLRRVKRRSLARLRAAVEPVDAACYARFLLRRHGIGEVRRGSARLAEALDQLAGLALPFGELEAALLPARVAAYEARQLDELIAQGRYAWIGRGALAQRELPIAFMPRESIATPPDVLPETPLEARLLEVLSARGASFFSEICAELRGVSEGELLAALHALAERGLATNDSLAPLRARMRARSAAAPRSRRLRGAAAPSPYGGRWSRIGARSGRAEEVSAASGSGLRFLQRRVEQMLARWGVIARAAAEFESIEGGFAALAEWLGALEERGALRRGNFVEGFAGAQYAEAGAVDRLRDERRQSERGEARLLAATDPAQPYGAVLDWPDARTGGRARRALGCRVVLVDGEPAFFAERGAQRLLSFPRGLHSDRQRGAALGALCGIPARGGLRVAEIDGEPALRSPLARELLVLGFRSDYKGLVFDGPPASAAPASIAGTTASE